MKKFFKITAICLGIILIGVYFCFLVVLPRIINLNDYKSALIKIVYDTAKLKLDFENPRLVTTPALKLGFKADNLTLKLPDNSCLLMAPSVKTNISLLQLLLLTVNITDFEADYLLVNLEIAQGKYFKVVRLIENIINEGEAKLANGEVKEAKNDDLLKYIKIKVTKAKLKEYSLMVNDRKNKHHLTLTGEELLADYNNGDSLRIKTNAYLRSDSTQMIKFDIDVNSFLPKKTSLDKEDDVPQRVEIPFNNPVLIYRDYNLKADVKAKMKLREKNGGIKIKGFLNAEDVTLNLKDSYNMPSSYIRTKFIGSKIFLNTNIALRKEQRIQAKGSFKFGKNSFMNIGLLTDKIYFDDLIKITKSFLNTAKVKNNLADFKGGGFLKADFNIRSNFKTMKSNGSLIMEKGQIRNRNLKIADIDAILSFDDNIFTIKSIKGYINETDFKAHGQVDNNSIGDISFNLEKVPVKNLFETFAPIDFKRNYKCNSGLLTLKADLKGKLKEPVLKFQVGLNNFSMSDRKNSLFVTTDALIGDFRFHKELEGAIKNKNLKIYFPSTLSNILVPQVNVSLMDDILLSNTKIKFNDTSIINLWGSIEDWAKNPLIDLTADGNLMTPDIIKFLGKQAAVFLKAKGEIPLKISFRGNKNRQTFILQTKSDFKNFITPVNISSLIGHQTIFQIKTDFKGDRLKIKDTGLFVKNLPDVFGNDLDSNMTNTKGIIKLTGTIAGLKTYPVINLIKFTIPEFEGDIAAFKGSYFHLGGQLFVFGNASSPRIRGNILTNAIIIPDLMTKIDKVALDFKGDILGINVNKIVANSSDIEINSDYSLNFSNISRFLNLEIKSNLIDVDKLMKVVDKSQKFAVQGNSNPSDIPVYIRNGIFNVKQIKTGNLVLKNTTGKLYLKNNLLYLNNLNSDLLGGNIKGQIKDDLLTSLLTVKVMGKNFNVEDTLLKTANMKDTLTGIADFTTDISLKGTTYEEQVKSLKGTVDFEIKNGQMGPFGKLENLILAENIRESEFFQSALGGVINSIMTFDTTHFTLMKGHLSFKDGIVNIQPLTSQGNIMSLYIFGNMDLLANQLDMKLRGKLGSAVSDMLGPLAMVNPVNLIKNTPGLNVVMAKAFLLFCEQVSLDEMQAIPEFAGDAKDANATKFQVVLKGDAAKPFSLIKSFKWLALKADIEQAEIFTESLLTPEEQMQKEKEDKKLKNRFKKFFEKVF